MIKVYLGEGRKSDKGDGKYVNRKFATFSSQLLCKEAKTDSEIESKSAKKKSGAQGNLLSQQLAHGLRVLRKTGTPRFPNS